MGYNVSALNNASSIGEMVFAVQANTGTLFMPFLSLVISLIIISQLLSRGWSFNKAITAGFGFLFLPNLLLMRVIVQGVSLMPQWYFFTSIVITVAFAVMAYTENK